MILVTSDIHLSSNPRDQYRHAFMDRFIGLIKSKKPKAVLILGDLTESKDRHEALLVNEVVEYLAFITHYCQLYLLQGNHDYVADPVTGFWHFIDLIKGITYISKPLSLVIDGLSCLFLPHTRDPDSLVKGHMRQYDWIFAHNTFEGAVGDHGLILDGIPLSIFPEDARVISGDVHRPQQLGCVTYVGAPYTVDFGDDYEPRILEIDGLTYKSIKCPGPQKRLIRIGGGLKDLDNLPHPGKGDILKIEIAIEDREGWPSARKAAQEWATMLGCTIDSIRPKIDNRSAGRAKLQQHKRSDEETVKQYATARNVGGMILDEGLELCHD